MYDTTTQLNYTTTLHHYTTCACQVPAGGAGFVSLDWAAGDVRYQLDRKFERLEVRVGSRPNFPTFSVLLYY